MSSIRVVLLASVITTLMVSTASGASSELLGLRTAVNPRATTLFLRFGAPVKFTPSWVGSRTFALDLAGASSPLSSEGQPLMSSLVSSYRLVNYKGAEGKPHLRVEITLKKEANVQPRQTKDGVMITVAEGPAKAFSRLRKARPNHIVPPNQKLGTAIRAVQVAKLENSTALEVQILGNGTLEYRTMRLRRPERLVIDIPNAVNRIHQKRLPVGVPPLRDVRIGQLSSKPLVSRVVMDLTARIPFRVGRRSNSLVVTLGVPAGRAAAAQGKHGHAAEPALRASAAKLKEIKTKKVAETEEPSLPSASGQKGSRVQAAKSNRTEKLVAKKSLSPARHAAGIPTLAASSGSKASGQGSRATSSASAVPVELSPSSGAGAIPLMRLAALQPLSEAGWPTVVASAAIKPDAAAAAAAATIRAEQRGGANSSSPEALPGSTVSQHTPLLAQQKKPSMGAKPSAPPVVAPDRKYTGEPISVDLKDVDLKDFFRLIHEISGLNVVLDPGVSGNVTIVLDQVPWDQAMEIVMRNNRLGKQVEGNVVRIAKLSTLEAEEKQQANLAVAAEEAQPKETVTHTLSYAKAADLIPTLKKFLTERGDIIADSRTNTLIITDIPPAVARVEKLVHTLDRKSQQVEIEARVVSASRSFARDIGMQLAASGLTGNVVLGGTGVVGASPILRGIVPPLFVGTPPQPALPGQPPRFANVAQPLNVNMPAQGATSGFSFLLTSGSSAALDAIITAAESKGIGKLLSRPKIITQNNVEATVQQGVKIPIQTTVNNTISVQYVNVVLRLTVTPQITADGTIFLKTDIENTSIDPGIATTPGQFGLDTQSATTQVLVSNGGTVFFGGVIQNINRVNQQEVPLLGSVPLLGNLFKRKQTTSTTNELLFFITPRIVQS